MSTVEFDRTQSNAKRSKTNEITNWRCFISKPTIQIRHFHSSFHGVFIPLTAQLFVLAPGASLKSKRSQNIRRNISLQTLAHVAANNNAAQAKVNSKSSLLKSAPALANVAEKQENVHNNGPNESPSGATRQQRPNKALHPTDSVPSSLQRRVSLVVAARGVIESVMIKDMIERLKQKCAASGVTLNSGTSEAAILEFEEKHNVQLPPSLRAYFMSVNGMPQYEIDGLARLWPLEEVSPVGNYFIHQNASAFVPEADSHFIIGDYNVEGSYWATQLTNPASDCPVVVIYDISSSCEQIAPNFQTFIERYVMEEPESLI